MNEWPKQKNISRNQQPVQDNSGKIDKPEDFPIHRFHHAFANDVFKSLSNMEQITIFSQLTVTLAFESFILTVINVSVPPEAVLPAKRYTLSSELWTCKTFATEYTQLHMAFALLFSLGTSTVALFSVIPVNLPEEKVKTKRSGNFQ